MGRGSRLAQALKSVWVGQHLASLLYQRGKAAGELLLLSHAALEHLLGFLPGWRAAQGGEAKRDVIGILDLTHPVSLSQAEKRCDGIGADRQADLVEPQRCGGLELVLERARTLAAHRLRRDGIEKRRTLGQRVVREALGFEQLLARQQRHGSISKPLDQRFARG